MPDREIYEFANPALVGTRVNDLIAKIARVSLRDTTRVLAALDLVSEATGDDADYIVQSKLSYDKPTPTEAELCAEAFVLIETLMGPDAIQAIRNMEER